MWAVRHYVPLDSWEISNYVLTCTYDLIYRYHVHSLVSYGILVSQYLVSFTENEVIISRVSVPAEPPWELFLYQSRASKVHSDAMSSGNNWSSAPSPGFQNGFKYLIATFSIGFTIVSHKWKAKRLRFCSSSLVPFQFCSSRSFLHGQSLRKSQL